MFKVISSQKEKVHVVCTGAQTNLALLLTVYPEVKENIAEIVFMGGAIGQGNTSPGAEFNIECDAEACKIVLESGLNITMVPLEVTHTVCVTNDILSRLEKMGSKFGTFIKDLLLFFKDSYLENFGFSSPPLHDPCAIAFLIKPEIFETKFCRVDVDTGSFSYGRTNCDIFGLTKSSKNVHVATKIDVEEFWNLMFEAFESANKVSILNKDL